MIRRGALTLALTLFAVTSAHATNGYFAHGYGVRAKAMGGVGIGLPQDALAPAHNPAGIGFLEDRLDLGLEWFHPKRGTTLRPTVFGPFGRRYHANDREHFFIPDFGVVYRLNERFTLGLTLYGNGGMNTNYGNLNARTAGLGALLFGAPADHGILGRGQAGVDLAQLFLAPTLALEVAEGQVVAFSPVFAAQRFKAEGLHNFANPVASMAPNSVTDRGYDESYGMGFHIGWMGRFGDVTVGASYQSRMWMTEFSKYNGLFAGGGEFDIPESYGVGIGWAPHPRFLLGADIQVIRYDRIRAIANPGNTGAPLGSPEGPGFGWRDVIVYKLGAAWKFDERLTFMFGGSWTNEPYKGTETFFNIVAPGTVRAHLTVGLSYRVNGRFTIAAYYARAFHNQVDGHLGAFGIDNDLAEDMAGIGLTWRFGGR